MRIFLLIFLIFKSLALSGQTSRQFDSEADLRNEVVHFIGNAERRIWLTTDYLTDGEIVTALTIAQYRKIDVQVLLGRSKASNPMSRLGYLKAQNIPVFLKSGKFKPDSATMVLIDDFEFHIDGELDSLARYKKFHFTTGSSEEKTSYEESFAAAAHLAMPANPKPIPLVGRPQWSKSQRAANKRQKSFNSAKEPAAPSEPGVLDDEGVFHYSKQPASRPDDVTPTLPKVPVWQERARKKEAGRHFNEE